LEYIIASEFIIPNFQNSKNLTFTEGTLRLLNSMIWLWLVLFVFLFEYYLNFVAEVTRFGDRQFYQVNKNNINENKLNRIGGIAVDGMSGPENGIDLYMNSYSDIFIWKLSIDIKFFF